jgi:type II secretory pathway pseudopilin PulG
MVSAMGANCRRFGRHSASAGFSPCPHRERGVAFLALLIGIAVLGTALGSAGTIWQQMQQREKERELLFVGLQYRHAIQHYYEQSPAGNAYPLTLEALLRDERAPGTRRYLRRPYRDPLTNSDQWGLVRAPTGGIMGVYSLAEGRPIKRANFPAELGWPGGKPSYADWQFVFLPPIP